MKKLALFIMLSGFAALCATGLPVRADAPPGQFTDLGDNTIQDNVTGLRWQLFPSSLVTHSEAIDYCGGLTLAGVRWRVPTVLELGSIVDDRRRDPALDPVFRTRGSFDVYWSSTPVRASPGNNYTVTAQLGYINGAAVANRLIVRCVVM